MYSAGGLFGSLLFGYVCEKIGRKKALHTIALPQILSFLLVAFANNSMMILISRIFAGFSGGAIYICVPLFVSEIAEDMWVFNYFVKREIDLDLESLIQFHQSSGFVVVSNLLLSSIASVNIGNFSFGNSFSLNGWNWAAFCLLCWTLDALQQKRFCLYGSAGSSSTHFLFPPRYSILFAEEEQTWGETIETLTFIFRLSFEFLGRSKFYEILSWGFKLGRKCWNWICRS